jgi:site-specific DNA-methyltransferase (adenine-specific)
MTTIDLRLGDWRTALDDVSEVDAVITDPPYGARTHDDESLSKQVVSATGQATRTRLSYSHFTPDDVREFVDAWIPRCRGWFAAMTSDDLIMVWKEAFEKAGRYAFAPVPWIKKRPRLIGDGPSSWACYIMVCRPRNVEFSRWGCLPGAYLPGARLDGEKTQEHIGGKPLWLMRDLVRDYSKAGNLICDPCAGSGTTLIAAEVEGRRAVGAELDPATYEKAKALIAKPRTIDLFAIARQKKEKAPTPLDLFPEPTMIPCPAECDDGIVITSYASDDGKVITVQEDCETCEGAGEVET